MASQGADRVAVSREVEASPREIFEILADPNRHVEIDGSGMLRGCFEGEPVSRVGDRFAMRMHNAEFGDYEMDNTVVEFEADRHIAWEPRRRDVVGEGWHHRWGYELQPGGEHTCLVTEYFDLSNSPEEAKRILRNGERWREAIEVTLDRLAELAQK